MGKNTVNFGQNSHYENNLTEILALGKGRNFDVIMILLDLKWKY